MLHARSWTATLGLAAGTTLLLLIVNTRSQTAATDPSASTPPVAEKAGDRAPKRSENPARAVELQLMIAGLGDDGCDVEVKPGNRGCRFRVQRQHVNAQGKGRFLFRDVEIRGADRNCTFAITLTEPGQASRTIYRGFRVGARPATPAQAAPVQSFTCYTNSPSRLARLEKPDRTTR